jgi:hypothetical protein
VVQGKQLVDVSREKKARVKRYQEMDREEQQVLEAFWKVLLLPTV